MPTILLEGRPVHYEEAGAGEPLLLIAGLGSDSGSWGAAGLALAERFRTVSIDNRGCGLSGTGGAPFTVGDMADDAAGVLDALGVRKACVVGHSMGGYVAQEMALRHPGRVRGLVLACTSLVSSERNNALFASFARELEAGVEYGAWIRRWAPWLFTPACLARPGFLDDFARQAAQNPCRQGAEGFRRQVEAVASFDARGRSGSVRCRTIVLAGEEDVLITRAESRALAGQVRGGTLTVIGGAAHSVHIEKCDEFVSAALGFLDDLD
jgi:pimeloyl-ACP methyl ester carboxylesterase